uniref:GS catalytic domain-containing protein n=1 Tax=Aureoumbra lagunensis TaxID=44058 RepID=A0A7S3NLF1_9STRA|mmetsp:Transcript_1469/g.2141  ORF Transcript_1469/g.2141 Transcript_1469/m.2141 type:complete len:583 (-) Transcript_1469:895-2643(-)
MIPLVNDDMLTSHSSHVYNSAVMEKTLPPAVHERFKNCIITGEECSEKDKTIIAEAIFKWARGLGATSFAHWFFPSRFGGGAVGGQASGLKYDAFIDLDWNADDSLVRPFVESFPPDRLFGGESDGSSFPSGGLRVTHAAAAFTTWDRASPCFIYKGVLRIPTSFVTHMGKCIDEKTPLLRSCDAINREGKRFLKAMGIFAETKAVKSFLGWEQEFFVVSAEAYKKRPDLMNCGRTLLGKLPPKHQQADLNYFAPIPAKVEELLVRVQAAMLQIGSPMSVRHNEVAPGQHEMSPIFCVANASCDSNVFFMELCTYEAAKLDLVVLFHEKPFKGINGSGKHGNWSIQTAEGLNFFHPGKNDQAQTLFVASIACLAYGLSQFNELVRVAVAAAGNDHRLGAQEAPPAIISLYPGQGFEAHVDAIIAGGSLLGWKADKKMADTGATAASAVETNVEDRNRTAPFPFCGNRFEFRAIGSSQNCAFPITVCNAIMAAGMRYLSSQLESGTPLRDAVAAMYEKNRAIIFCGNGYSKEWPLEAAKRGLPNLNNTPLALAHFATPKNKAILKELEIFAEDETDARSEVFL